MRLVETKPLRQTRLWFGKRRVFWQQLLVIVALLAFVTLAAAVRLPLLVSAAVMALPILIVGVYVLIRWPPLGLVAMIAALLLLKTELIEQFGLAAIMVMGLTAVWLFDMFIIKRKADFINNRLFIPILLFLVVNIIAFFNGQLPWYPIAPAPLDGQIGAILILIVAISGLFLAAHQIREVKWLKMMLFTFFGISAFFIFGRIIPGGDRIVFRFFSFYVASGSMFWVWLIVMLFAQMAFNKRLDVRWRAAMGVLLLGALYLTLGEARAWVSGWFPSLLAVIVALWLGAPRAAFFVSMGGGVLVLTKMQAILDEFIYIGDNSYSETTRLEAWRIIGEIVKVSPFFGLGPANYSYYTSLFPILGWYVQFNSHNNYVDIVAQTGIIGLLCFIWFIFEVMRFSWRVYKMVPKGGFLYAYVVGTFGGLTATFVAGMLGDWFLPYVYNATIRAMRTSIFPWLFLGGLVAVEQILKSDRVTR